MTNMKRSLSDSDSDHDDLDDLKSVGSPSQSGHGPDRKKRRGVIEKRRRDRINNSLSELRRLVPTAFEKQGSAKLEKAEILQMAVDHLKVLHQKGLNGYNFDPASLAMDYRSVGFRECAAEVARYLVTCEGMDIQDPLRLRLMSHLQCYSAQRDAASKHTHTFQGNSWNGLPTHHGLNSQYNTGSVGSMPPPPPSMISQHGTQTDQLSLTSQLSAGLTSVSCADTRLSQPHPADPQSHHMRLSVPTTGSVAPQIPSVTSSTGHSQMAPVPLHNQFASVHSQFPVSLSVNSMPMLSPSGTHSYSPPSTTALGQAVKPYRPWGAELAY